MNGKCQKNENESEKNGKFADFLAFFSWELQCNFPRD